MTINTLSFLGEKFEKDITSRDPRRPLHDGYGFRQSKTSFLHFSEKCVKLTVFFETVFILRLINFAVKVLPKGLKHHTGFLPRFALQKPYDVL